MVQPSTPFFLNSNVLANESLKKLSEEQKIYVRSYIEAVNSNDLGKVKTLMHSSYLDCINLFNQDYFDDLFRKSLKYNIPEDFVVFVKSLSDENVAKEMEGAKQWGLPFPVKPTHQLQIDFDTGEYSSVTLIRKLVQEGANFYEVSGCPSGEMVEKFREIKIKKSEASKRAKELNQELEEPLLTELTQLLKDGRKIDAWKKYSEVTGESLATAKEVLSHIQVE